MLSAPERTRLEARLAERERATGAQMVIAVFSSLEGESLEDVSIRLAEKWKVGKKGVDNGVILVVFLKERKLRLEVGYGLEPVITDAVSAGIIGEAIAPRFREQRYAAGLEAAVDAVFAKIGGRTAAPRRAEDLAATIAGVLITMLILSIPAVFIVFFVGAAIAAVRPRPFGYTASGSGWTSHSPGVSSGGFSGGSFGGGGGGGGGFSGGGGSFGGGGASGSW